MPRILPAERFWSHVLKTDTCWLWQGSRGSTGYGTFGVSAKQTVKAHRFAYELTYGLILPGLFCCHHCDVRLCVRPDHLFLGTRLDNMRDMSSKKRSSAYTHPESFPRGEKHPRRLHPEKYTRGEQSFRAKLTESQVREIRHLRATELWTQERLASFFGVKRSQISKIILHKNWRHIP